MRGMYAQACKEVKMAKKGNKGGGHDPNSHSSRTISESGGYYGKANKSPDYSSPYGDINAALQKAFEMAAASYPGYVEAASGYESHGKTKNHDVETGGLPGGSALDYGRFSPFGLDSEGNVDPKTGKLIHNGTYAPGAPGYADFDQRMYDMMATFNPELADKMRFGANWGKGDNMHIDLRGGSSAKKPKEGHEYTGNDYSAPTQLDTIAKHQMLNNQLHPEDMNSLMDPTMSVEMDANYAPNISDTTKWNANDGDFNGMPGLFAGGLDMLNPANVTNYQPGQASYPANNQPGGFNGFGTLDRKPVPQSPGVISKLQEFAKTYDPISGVINGTNTVGDFLKSIFTKPQAAPQVQAPQAPERALPGPSISPVETFHQPAHPPSTMGMPAAGMSPYDYAFSKSTFNPFNSDGSVNYGKTMPNHPPSTGMMPGHAFGSGGVSPAAQLAVNSTLLHGTNPPGTPGPGKPGELGTGYSSTAGKTFNPFGGPSIGNLDPGVVATSKLYTNSNIGAMDPAQVTGFVKTLNPAYTQAMKAYADKANYDPMAQADVGLSPIDAYSGVAPGGFAAAFGQQFGPPMTAKAKPAAAMPKMPPKYINVPKPVPKPQFASLGTPNYTGNGAAGLTSALNDMNASVMNSAKAFGYDPGAGSTPATTLGSVLGSMFGGGAVGGYQTGSSKAYGNQSYGVKSYGGGGGSTLGGGDDHKAL